MKIIRQRKKEREESQMKLFEFVRLDLDRLFGFGHPQKYQDPIKEWTRIWTVSIIHSLLSFNCFFFSSFKNKDIKCLSIYMGFSNSRYYRSINVVCETIVSF